MVKKQTEVLQQVKELAKKLKQSLPPADSQDRQLSLVEMAHLMKEAHGESAEEFLALATAVQNAKSDEERDALMLKYLSEGLN